MKLHHIALQRLRDDARALALYLCIASGGREAHGFSQMIFRYAPPHAQDVAHINTGGDLRKYGLNDIVDRSPVCLLRLLKGQGDHLSLALCARKVRIHQPQAAVRNSLHAVQMVHARMLQLIGSHPCGRNGL